VAEPLLSFAADGCEQNLAGVSVEVHRGLRPL
jgi:hypothetical protein